MSIRQMARFSSSGRALTLLRPVGLYKSLIGTIELYEHVLYCLLLDITVTLYIEHTAVRRDSKYLAPYMSVHPWVT